MNDMNDANYTDVEGLEASMKAADSEQTAEDDNSEVKNYNAAAEGLGSLETSHYTTRFSGIPTVLKAPLLENVGADKATVGFVGIPYDGGVVRTPGTRFGPRGIRNTSWRVNEYNAELEVNPFEIHNLVDCGDVRVNPLRVDQTTLSIEASITKLLDDDIIPISIGGDHYVTYPILRAMGKKHGPVAVIQFDAHLDMADGGEDYKYCHGTMFTRAHEDGAIKLDKMIQVGIRKLFFPGELDFGREHGVEVIRCTDLLEMKNMREELAQRFARLKGEKVYVTYDIDYIDPTYAPATGSPEIAGPNAHQALESIRALKDLGLDIVGMDLVEIAPEYDTRDLTSLLGVQILHEMASVLEPTV